MLKKILIGIVLLAVTLGVVFAVTSSTTGTAPYDAANPSCEGTWPLALTEFELQCLRDYEDVTH